MADFIDSQIESTAKAFTESFAFARYASTAAPVHYPRTVYLFKWIAMFFDGKARHFMLYQRNNTAGWQKVLYKNQVTYYDPHTGIADPPQTVTEKWTPPLIGNPEITAPQRIDPLVFNNTYVFQPVGADAEVLEPIDQDLFLNQMIGPAQKTGSMKSIIDTGILQNASDGDELFFSYKDNMSDGFGRGFDPGSLSVDRTGITGELQQVNGEYFNANIVSGQLLSGIGYAGTIPGTLKPILQAVSYTAFDDFGDVMIAQTLVPTPAEACIMIEWVLVVDQTGANQYFQFPVVTPVTAQTAPYLIPIPDIKTIWDRAPGLLPYTNSSQQWPRGIANKLYPQFKTEAAWRAAGAHF